MKLTVLVDNNTYIDQYYLGEPAVSYYIEDGDSRILFDAGYSDIFISNAEKMGIDLNKVSHIIFSHGHDDHTRGLNFFAEKFDLSSMELIAHPDCFLPKFNGGLYVGSPYMSDDIASLCRYTPCTEPKAVTEKLIYLGQIPRGNDFENQHPIGKTEKNGTFEDDWLVDDTALAYKTDDGIFIITGCSHSGICNIIEHAKAVCGDDRVLGVLGGFHLFNVDEQLKKTIEYLESCNIKQFYPCHCVSLICKAKMMEKLPVKEVGVGMTLEI